MGVQLSIPKGTRRLRRVSFAFTSLIGVFAEQTSQFDLAP
jgi:hypothetical protein